MTDSEALTEARVRELIKDLRDTARQFARDDPAPDAPAKSYIEWRAADALAALSALGTAPAVLDDMVLLPRTPTAAMKEAGMDVLMHGADLYANDEGQVVVETTTPGDLYRAMIEASPISANAAEIRAAVTDEMVRLAVTAHLKANIEQAGYFGRDRLRSVSMRAALTAALAASPAPANAAEIRAGAFREAATIAAEFPNMGEYSGREIAARLRALSEATANGK